MEDNLEKFIRSNRQAFDSREPKESTWNAIEGSLFQSPKFNAWNSLTVWRAAAMLLLVLSVSLIIPRDFLRGENSSVALKEFNEVEAYYTKQITQKAKLIEEITPDLENQFSEDFHQLDAMYQVLKEEMKTRPSKKVKDALVLNLMVRINLLNQQLQQLEKVEAGERKTESTI